MTDFQFKLGDRVVLTLPAVRYYGGVSGANGASWTPTAQGGGKPGTITFAGDRPYRPGASPRPYFVKWDNGFENSYREEDLTLEAL